MKIEIKLTGAPKEVVARLRQTQKFLAAGLDPKPFPYYSPGFPYYSPGFLGDKMLPHIVHVTAPYAAGLKAVRAKRLYEESRGLVLPPPCPGHPYYRALRTPRTKCPGCWRAYRVTIKARREP